MSARAPSSTAREAPRSREGIAFLLSLAAHLTMAAVIVWVGGARPVEPRPFEVTFMPGPPEPASPPPGEPEAGPGTTGPPPAPEPLPEARPAEPEARSEPEEVAPKPPPARPKPEQPVEERGLLGALGKAEPEQASRTRAFPGLDSPVRLRERPAEALAPGGDGREARTEADVPVEERLLARSPPRSGGERLQAGDAPLPGGGVGVGVVTAPGAGGTGRGGFSVTGAGAGGQGRSYQSIWDHTQQYLAGLRWAYNRELRHEPELRGVLLVRFEILSSGKVGSVRLVSSELGNRRFEQEVVSQIQRWTYPPEDAGDVAVTWPFSFLPPSS